MAHLNLKDITHPEGMNHFGESIPDAKVLFQEIVAECDSFAEHKFRFSDLFTESDTNEFNTNTQFITENIPFNNKRRQTDSKFNTIKGLYLLHDTSGPAYVGISQNILTRIKQHFLGRTHSQASLAYLIALILYEKEKNENYNGLRNEFPFREYRTRIQETMRKDWWITIYPETDNFRMHIKEVYLTCTKQTPWNSFATH